MKKNLTELVFVIDRNGSMGGLESDTIGGVNAVLAQNRKVEGETNVTTILFDHRIEYLHDHIDLREVADLTDRDYYVRGCTALLDAVGEAITHTERVQHCLPRAYRAQKVIVTIVTDGLENASQRYSYPQVKKLIDQKTRQGWEFLFLGANIDVAAEAGKLGIAQEFATPYVSDGAGTQVAYDAIAYAQKMSRTGGCAPVGWADSARRRRQARLRPACGTSARAGTSVLPPSRVRSNATRASYEISSSSSSGTSSHRPSSSSQM